MINTLHTKHFKCFESLSLPVKPLTLLTGFNAAGKSTALQGLLLLAQSLKTGMRSAELSLNGPLVKLGTFADVYNPTEGNIVFGVEDDAADIKWTLRPKEGTKSPIIQIRDIQIKTETGVRKFDDVDFLEYLIPTNASIHTKNLVNRIGETVFVSAMREGTADVFPSPEEASPVRGDVGVRGEYAPWWFQRSMDEVVDESRCNPADLSNEFRRQFNAWAGMLFPNAQANAYVVGKTSLLHLELRIGDTAEWKRPSNIGYGLTYAFPIIVTGLLAKRNQIVVIDSPEAHLHPFGQSQMGRFLAHIAAAGVQVIVETHSDHIINGVRLAAKEKVISPDQIAVHFFTHLEGSAGRANSVVSPLMEREGNLSEWPEGFFDQSEKDLSRLVGWV